MDLKELNSDRYVAHYTNFDRVIKNILPSNQIRVSSASKVNDPYERDFTWTDSEACCTDKEAIECCNLLSELNPHIYNYIKLFCVASYDKKSNCSDLSCHIYAKPRMWASYGDNCKGLCLVFDKEELSKEFNKTDSVKVDEGNIEYIDFLSKIENSVTLSIFELREIQKKSKVYNPELLYKAINKNNLLKSKYFRKHIDWETENEYRWLVFAKETKDLNINFAKSLKAIVFGVDTDVRYRCLFKDYDIPLFKLKFEYGKYNYHKLEY